jgi:hypothetical protein
VNHRLYRHPQRCIELRIAAAASTSTILSISSITVTTSTATAIFYYYRWLQPLSITTTLHSCRSRPPPFSTDTARFLPLFATATVAHRHFFLRPLSTAAVLYRRRSLPVLHRTAATATATTAATATATTATSPTAATTSTTHHTTTAAADRCCCFNYCHCSLLQSELQPERSINLTGYL